jgi:hypothetical protein
MFTARGVGPPWLTCRLAERLLLSQASTLGLWAEPAQAEHGKGAAPSAASVFSDIYMVSLGCSGLHVRLLSPPICHVHVRASAALQYRVWRVGVDFGALPDGARPGQQAPPARPARTCTLGQSV